MPVLTNKRHTETAKRVRLSFTGPASRQQEAVAELAALGFTPDPPSASDAVPWQQVFADALDNMPGIVLSAARAKAGLTQVEL